MIFKKMMIIIIVNIKINQVVMFFNKINNKKDDKSNNYCDSFNLVFK